MRKIFSTIVLALGLTFAALPGVAMADGDTGPVVYLGQSYPEECRPLVYALHDFEALAAAQADTINAQREKIDRQHVRVLRLRAKVARLR
jgi:hypothetical protein